MVPRPGEVGHDTWPQDSDIWQVGGGGVWLVGTVDPDLGMVYFSTGNPVPMYGGEIRAGDNLFTASVLALDMETGERRWHYQVVRHDIWDADIATPVLLYDTEIDGEPVPALAAIRADGYLFLFNREDGRTDRGARGPAGAAGRPPPDRGDAAVPGRCREHPAGLFVLARSGAAAVHAQLQRLHAAGNRSTCGGRAERADPDSARHADGVLAADRLHLRPGGAGMSAARSASRIPGSRTTGRAATSG